MNRPQSERPGEGVALPSFGVSTRIFAGVSAPRVLHSELSRLNSRRVGVVTDAGIVKANLLAALLDWLPARCALVTIFSDVPQDPTVTVMDQAGRLCRDEKIDTVIAVGGGACLDTGKAAAIVASSGGSILDAVGENKLAAQPLPVIALPTTAGTGSEVTWHISVNDVERQLKVTVRSPLAVPASAILDPDLIATVPPLVAAGAGMDALTHSLESYVGNAGAWDLTDAISLHACEMIGRSLIPYWTDPCDRYHAAQMLLASCFGGLVLSHSRTGIVHQMARPLGAHFHVPHGLANAVLLPWCLEFTCVSRPERFARVAQALGEDVDGLSDEEAAGRAVRSVRRINRQIGIPASLAELEVTADGIEQMAVDALQGRSGLTNPCVATRRDVIDIYQRALRGEVHD